MKISPIALAAFVTSTVFADLPYTEYYTLDGSSDFELEVKANSTKVFGATNDTKINIAAVSVDEAYVASNGNTGEVVFCRGEFTNNGNLYAHMVDITNSTYDQNWTPVTGVTNFINNGTIVTKHESDSYQTLYVQGGATLTNNGTITASTTVKGNSTLIAEDGSIFNHKLNIGLDSSVGTFLVDGDITLNAELWGWAGQIIFTEGSSINMNGYEAYDLDNISLVYQIDGVADENVLADALFLNSNVSKDTAVTIQGSNGSTYTTTVGKLLIPEPSTATLSLLALAGLVMRRRRH